MKCNYGIFVLILLMFLYSCRKEQAIVNTAQGEPAAAANISFKLYDGLEESITAPIIEKMNLNYMRILDDLCVASVEKTIVEIWNDETHFQNDMKASLGINYWGATGYVYNKNTVRVLNRGDVSKTVLHEFTHTVSMHVQSYIPNNPRWLWETIALYETGDFTNPKNISYLASGNFPSIDELNNDFNSGNQKIYKVGYLLGEYIVEKFGKDKYVLLIKNLGNIKTTLGLTTQQFESGWKEFVTGKYLQH